MAPQKAPSPPISAATVARAEPRFLTSAAIAAYRDGQAAEPEKGQRARDVELSRMSGRDGQHLEDYLKVLSLIAAPA